MFKKKLEGMLSVKRKQDEISDDVDELLFLVSSLIVKNKTNETGDIQLIIDSVHHLFESIEDCENFVKTIYKNKK
jgi:hypothetical protein